MRYLVITFLLLINESIDAQEKELQNQSVPQSNQLLITTFPENDEKLIMDSISIPETTKSQFHERESKKKISKPAAKSEADSNNKYDYNDAPVNSTTIDINSKYYSYGFEQSKQQSVSQRTQKNPSEVQQKEMDEAVEYFKSNAPSSFEYHYFKYVSGNYNVDLIEFLKEAEKIRPDNADVHVQLAAYSIIKEENKDALYYLEKLKKSGRLQEQVIQYAEDILLSAPENGLLITHGFDDSYSVMYLQLQKKIRPDVTIVSLDFLQSDYYRSKLISKGISIPENEIIDVSYLQSFCRNNNEKKVSMSLTTPKEYFEPIQDKLYVVGLVFEYHEERFDNYYRNENLWKYILKKHVVTQATNEKSKQLSANYLPMLLQLRKIYDERGQTENFQSIDAEINHIGVQCKKYDQVQKLKNAY